MHAKKLLAHKFDPFPAVTLSEFCLFAPAILHTITPRRHKKTGHCVRFVIVSVSVQDDIVAQRISERSDGSIASIKIPSSILVDNSEAFLSCGLAGLGVLHGLRPSLAPFIASGELTEILTDFPPPPKPVSLLYPDRRYLAPKVRVFIDWLCEVFGPDAHL